jgi:cysteine desulfurase/selenocysteine lyase
MNLTFLGGGMVDDVQKDSYILSAKNEEHIHTALEPGLQPYAEIIGLGAAIKWMKKAEKDNHILDYSRQLIDFLRNGEGLHVLNHENTTTIAFYSDKFDAHLLAEALSDAGIMTRSGHFCAHYYLAHVKKYPPLVRLSLGLHNRQSDINKFIEVMEKVAG